MGKLRAQAAAETVARRPVRQVIPVIMSGGSGVRLWPVSTETRPKQFHALVSSLTMLQDTVLRTKSNVGGAVEFLAPILICNRRHRALISAQLEAIGCEPTAIVLEPVARNTAAVAAIAARLALEHAPGAAVLLAPADHVITEPEAFRAVVGRGLAVADEWIVTFGIEPTTPETGYGYIQSGRALTEGVYEVRRFAEKPAFAVAEAYLAEGGYAWNAGIFLFSPDVMLAEMAAHRPDILTAVSAALDASTRDGRVINLDESSFAATPSQSIDLAVMEPTQRAAVAPCSVGWADVGSWSELWRQGPLDQRGNLVKGRAVALESDGSLVWGEDATVGVIGLSDVVAVASRGSVLVAPRARAQEVRRLLELVKPGDDVIAAQSAASAELAKAAGRLQRWLVQDALPVWARLGVDPSSGGFIEAIGHDGSPSIGERRARVQARQIYVYATAVTRAWGSTSNEVLWRGFARRGFDDYQARYLRPDGLFRNAVRADGAPADDTAYLYEQAFALFAMAAVQRLDRDGPDRTAQARRLHHDVCTRFAATHGGYAEASHTRPYQANAQMHLLEAALAWSELDARGPWPGLADALVELALDRFIDPATGALHEVFEADWGRARSVEHRIVEPGHQFEWATLLTRWAAGQRAGEPRRDAATAAAQRLYELGAAAGIDDKRGVAIDALTADLQPSDASARLWPQTERIRAAVVTADLASDAETKTRRLQAAAEAVQGLELYLDTPLAGLWRDKLDPAGRFADEPAPASSLYHIVGAAVELERWMSDQTQGQARR